MAEIRICLDQILQEKNISRYALAKAVGVQYQTIDKYYKNRITRYDKDLILKICLALDCTPGDLIQLKDKKKDAP